MRIDTIYFRLHKLAGTEISVTRIRAKVEIRSNNCLFLFFDAYRKSFTGCVCYEVKLKPSSFGKKNFFLYLAMWGLSWGTGDLGPWPGTESGHLPWEHRVLATGSPRNSLSFYYWIHLWFSKCAQVLKNGMKPEKHLNSLGGIGKATWIVSGFSFNLVKNGPNHS